MFFRFLSIWILLLFTCNITAQLPYFNLSGRITDYHESEALPDAQVLLLPDSIIAKTDLHGNFEFRKLKIGDYQLCISHIGCPTECNNYQFNSDTFLNIVLDHHEIDLGEVIVPGHKHESLITYSTTKLSNKELVNRSGLNAAALLKQIPGVQLLNTGSTISKPIIHGLHSQRLVILNHGLRLESQQWGSEHGVELDPALFKEVSVIKGAAGVKYGNDALGGVILFSPKALPFYKTELSGNFSTHYFSANNQLGSSLILNGTIPKLRNWAFEVFGSYQRAGNMRTPKYFQKNSGFKQGSAAARIGGVYYKWNIELMYQMYISEIGILSSAHIGNITDLKTAINSSVPLELDGFTYNINRPSQKILHQIAKAEMGFRTGNIGKLNAVFGWQTNKRAEFDKHKPLNDSLANLNNPAFLFEIQSLQMELNWKHNEVKNWIGEVGISGTTQTNNYDFSYFIPAFWNFGVGLYATEKWTKGNWELEAGLRLDYKWIQAYLPSKYGKSKPIHQFFNPSGILGVEYHINKAMIVSYRFSTAWRPPHVSEWYSDGLHHGSAIYEKGNPNLLQENAFSNSIHYELNHSKVKINSELYFNYVKNYIFSVADTSPILTSRGAFPSFKYIQTNAFLTGFDLNAIVTLWKYTDIRFNSSILLARNVSRNNWLDFMPPQRFEYGLDFRIPDFSVLKKNVIKLFTETVLEQKLVFYSDYTNSPKTYHLLSMEFSSDLHFKKQKIEFGLLISNILNTPYREYLNRFRYFTDEKGLDIQLRINLPLQLTFKKNTNEKQQIN